MAYAIIGCAALLCLIVLCRVAGKAKRTLDGAIQDESKRVMAVSQRVNAAVTAASTMPAGQQDHLGALAKSCKAEIDNALNALANDRLGKSEQHALASRYRDLAEWRLGLLEKALEQAGVAIPEPAVPFYSAGPCPACGEFGSQVFAKSATSKAVFLFCPACDLAWDKPQRPYVVDTLDPVTKYAPQGVEFPTRDEIDAAGLGRQVVGQLDADSAKMAADAVARG